MNVVRIHPFRQAAYVRTAPGTRTRDAVPPPARTSPQGVPVSNENARFASVVLPHLADAYSLARWLTGNRADAEDVVQDACLRAFRALDSYAGGSARAWVLTIVPHSAYAWLRKNRPTALVTVDDLEAVESANANPSDVNAGTPETELIAKTESARLEAAIADLPSPFRETLVLRDVQGLDYREIAEVTGVAIGTVMSRLARARRRLIMILTGSER